MRDSLENKFRLATIAPLDRRMKRKHLAVYGFLLDWYHRKYGDALASVRHIVAKLKERDPFGIGLYQGDVHSALKDLIDWGYITVEKGTGRRASRYVPVWVHGSYVRETPNTTDDEISVRENQNTSVREIRYTTGDSVRETPNEDPLTVTRLQDGVTVKEGLDCAPASPPPTVGLEATAAGGAQDVFEELWKAYGYRQKKADAKAAYLLASRDADTHRKMVEAAEAWFASWSAQGNPDAPRFTLAKWIEREEYECDPPRAFSKKDKPVKATVPAKTAPKAGNDNAEVREEEMLDLMIGWPSTWPAGVHTGEFTDGLVTIRGKNTEVCMTFLRDDGREFKHRFWVEASIQSHQEEGQQIIRDIVDALGIPGVEDTDDLLFKPIAVEADGSNLNYFNIKEAA
ncbi:hypothetical protein [Agrobacterium tumefaciens]|uniref:hypothetical protein n=1 Tax=Agrobacterium tumefaciens TaxID=358 RepID=UPI000975F6C2|nr:hypothetical protein [Agrobacterium tumefaciens]NSZ68735.1 hypothetical protein [Agrobacterium tumefaciens]OMP69504.1 hypothetical protein BV900_24725 [Agrobacterium tumefaciens]